MIIQGGYNLFSLIVLLAWVPIILVLFLLLPGRRAVIASFVVGYLFLPELNFRFHTLPEINKVSLTEMGVILASLLFDGGRLFAVRFKWIDLAWLSLSFTPIVSSLMNDLGIMDGLASSLTVICRWGLAYWIGRAYFTDWQAVRELAIGIILGGLAYAPLCWWEIRMSPRLHGRVYGFLFESFRRNALGWRPNVFLNNSLSVTMYMGVSALLAFWAWMSGSPRKLFGVPMGYVALFLLVSAFFCKALGGIVLMTGGISVLLLTKWWPRTKIPALCMIAAAPTYILLRSSGEWSGDRLVEAAQVISVDRAKSLEYRLVNENMLTKKALQQPWFGWGGWNRSHVLDDEGNDRTIVDGLWIIMLGEHGILGVTSFVLSILGTALLVWYWIPARFWTDAACAAVVALSVAITMYMIDSLFNATFNPVASLAAGALASISTAAAATFRKKVSPPSRRVSPLPLTAAARPSYA